MRTARFALATLALTFGAATSTAADRPNVVWLSFEDTSADELGCYGNPYAATPTLDAVAARGLRFSRACSVAPHCSPARATLISGSPAVVHGTDVHRFPYPVPEGYYFPTLLREAGYFTSNNAKTDYNAAGWKAAADRVWDRQGKSATYNDPARGDRPFFSVFNQDLSHMGRLRSFHLQGRRDFAAADSLGVAPAELTLPTYLPDLPELRSDLAFHLEAVTDIDTWVRLCLDDLEARGLLDSTFVFIFSDHGGCLPRGKGYPYESGLRVPLVVHVPERFSNLVRHPLGQTCDWLVGFEDFAPTVLKLCGIEPPVAMWGRDVLGPDARPKRYQFAFRTNHATSFDPVRVVTDGRYRYIRSYVPHRPTLLWQGYQWGCPGHWALYEAAIASGENGPLAHFLRGKPGELLFDSIADPGETKNLAGDPEHAEKLTELRDAVSRMLRASGDVGLVPPSLRPLRDGQPLGQWGQQNDRVRLRLIDTAELASEAGSLGALESQRGNEVVRSLLAAAHDAEPSIRYYAAAGLATLAQRFGDAVPGGGEMLLQMANVNDNPHIRSEAILGLAYAGELEAAASRLVRFAAAHEQLAVVVLDEVAPLFETRRELLTPLVDGEAALALRFRWRLDTLEHWASEPAKLREGRRINRDRRSWTKPLP